jgi:hypothetical protein
MRSPPPRRTDDQSERVGTARSLPPQARSARSSSDAGQPIGRHRFPGASSHHFEAASTVASCCSRTEPAARPQDVVTGSKAVYKPGPVATHRSRSHATGAASREGRAGAEASALDRRNRPAMRAGCCLGRRAAPSRRMVRPGAPPRTMRILTVALARFPTRVRLRSQSGTSDQSGGPSSRSATSIAWSVPAVRASS